MKIDDSSRDAVMARLAPHLPTLDSCFNRAWKRWTDWLKLLPGSPADVTGRSRASMLYDFIAAEAIRAFLGKKGIQVRRERGFLVLRFSDHVALRFKKFRSKSLRVSMSKTGQAELFNGQGLEFAPGSLKPMTHVIAGYLLDGLAMDIARLAITCSHDGVPMWAPIDILPAPAKSAATLPAVAQQPVRKATVRSARSASARKQRQDEPGSS
jgi:hypothetical protein